MQYKKVYPVRSSRGTLDSMSTKSIHHPYSRQGCNHFASNGVYLGKSKISGKGIFAKNDIKKNEKIFVFKGRTIKDSYGPNYWVGQAEWLGIGECLWLRVPKNNMGRFINHSCNLNAGFSGTKTVVAIRNIKKDEEITIDYSTTEDDPYWKMKCTCRAKNCRKLLRSVRFLPKNFFKKYRLFMPKFAVKSYLKYNSKTA